MGTRSTPAPRGCRTAAIAMLAVLLVQIAGAAEISDSAEPARTAATVTRIAKFVSWPHGALGSNGAAIRVCVAENRALLEALREFDDVRIHGRPMSLLLVSTAAQAAIDCDILYVGKVSIDDRDSWFEIIGPLPILTFDESGSRGIVSIRIRRNKVLFSIDTDASDAAGLGIGAQLLHLASLMSRRSR